MGFDMQILHYFGNANVVIHFVSAKEKLENISLLGYHFQITLLQNNIHYVK